MDGLSCKNRLVKQGTNVDFDGVALMPSAFESRSPSIGMMGEGNECQWQGRINGAR